MVFSIPHPKKINDTFKQFYEELYTSKSGAQSEDIQEFLNKCKLPMLDKMDHDNLNFEITKDEILKSIGILTNGKSPGPDGLGNEIYKKFSDSLAPYLLKMYNQAFKDGALPQTLN